MNASNEIPEHPFTCELSVGADGTWWTAICPELMVSGMGSSAEAAVLACQRSVRSMLLVLSCKMTADPQFFPCTIVKV